MFSMDWRSELFRPVIVACTTSASSSESVISKNGSLKGEIFGLIRSGQ